MKPVLELIEKLSAIREYLASLTQVTDVRKLAELTLQKTEIMWDNYQELAPYMTAEQKSRATQIYALGGAAEGSLRKGDNFVTTVATRLVPLMIADLDDIAEALKAEVT